MRRKLTNEYIALKFKEFSSIKEIQLADKSVYNAAYKRGILADVSAHMKLKRSKKSEKECLEAALKCSYREEFKNKYSSEYQASIKYGIIDKICSHMVHKKHMWTNEELAAEALKYNSKIEFQKQSRNAYVASINKNLLNSICSHMIPLKRYEVSRKRFKHTEEQLKLEALKYTTRKEFSEKGAVYYSKAVRDGILDKICSHMSIKSPFSRTEQDLMQIIKTKYPKAQKLYDKKVNITNRPYIRGFEIDIYIPELRKGIEFDGRYHHSINGLKRGRPSWPVDDLKSYHEIKDQHFKSKEITILHIKEEEWNKNKENCLSKIWQFLE